MAREKNVFYLWLGRKLILPVAREKIVFFTYGKGENNEFTYGKGENNEFTYG